MKKKMIVIWASILPLYLFGTPKGVSIADIMRPNFESYNEPVRLAEKYDVGEFALAYRFFLSEEGVCVTLLCSPGRYEPVNGEETFGNRWWTNGGVVEIAYRGKDKKTRVTIDAKESGSFIMDMGRWEFFNLSEQSGLFQGGSLGGGIVYAERIYSGERTVVYRVIPDSIPSIFVREKLLQLIAKAEDESRFQKSDFRKEKACTSQ